LPAPGAGMTCGFDLAHYCELLDAADEGGYRPAFFDREPQPGDLFLRHDVDMSLDAALAMAELEAERGVAATYFMMTRSDFYNLDSRAGDRALARLRELGHRVGLHGVYPEAIAPTRTSTGAEDARTKTSPQASSCGSSYWSTRRSGSTTARRCARRCSRSSTPSARRGSG